MPLKLIYICGPYRSSAFYSIHRNIQRAEEAAAMIWQSGAVAVCPHKNSAYFDGLVEDDGIFLNGYLELLRRCDALFLSSLQCKKSSGTIAELRLAKELDLPTFWTITAVRNWLASKEKYRGFPRIIDRLILNV